MDKAISTNQLIILTADINEERIGIFSKQGHYDCCSYPGFFEKISETCTFIKHRLTVGRCG
jgi:hypothetical protein